MDDIPTPVGDHFNQFQDHVADINAYLFRQATYQPPDAIDRAHLKFVELQHNAMNLYFTLFTTKLADHCHEFCFTYPPMKEYQRVRCMANCFRKFHEAFEIVTEEFDHNEKEYPERTRRQVLGKDPVFEE